MTPITTTEQHARQMRHLNAAIHHLLVLWQHQDASHGTHFALAIAELQAVQAAGDQHA